MSSEYDAFDDADFDLNTEETPEEKREKQINIIRDNIVDELYAKYEAPSHIITEAERQELDERILAIHYVSMYVRKNKDITLEELEGLKYSDNLIMGLFPDAMKAQIRQFVSIC